MLSKTSQTQKDQYWVIRPIGGIWSSQTQRQEVEQGLRRGLGSHSVGAEFQFCWRWMVVIT